MINWAICISFSRIVLALITVWCLSVNQFQAAIVSFVLAAFSDILDGFVARRYNQQTIFGQILDPVADKIYVISVMAVFAYLTQYSFVFYALSFLLVKEFILLSVGGWLWFMHHCFIQPSKLSRITSFFEFVLLFLLLLSHAGYMVQSFIFIIAIASVACSVLLFIVYGLALYKKWNINH